MENNEYKILSEDAIKYLCSLIRDLASVSEGIDNINLADDKTFSNIHIKNLIDKCLEDANAKADETYVAKENGKSLIADTEIERLASINNYDDTEITSKVSNIESAIETLNGDVSIEGSVAKQATITVNDALNNYYTKTEVDEMLGDIASVLDTINGEII